MARVDETRAGEEEEKHDVNNKDEEEVKTPTSTCATAADRKRSANVQRAKSTPTDLERLSSRWTLKENDKKEAAAAAEEMIFMSQDEENSK